jgi:hypothetical protein
MLKLVQKVGGCLEVSDTSRPIENRRGAHRAVYPQNLVPDVSLANRPQSGFHDSKIAFSSHRAGYFRIVHQPGVAKTCRLSRPVSPVVGPWILGLSHRFDTHDFSEKIALILRTSATMVAADLACFPISSSVLVLLSINQVRCVATLKSSPQEER